MASTAAQGTNANLQQQIILSWPPPGPPPIITWLPNNGITVLGNQALFEVKLELTPVQIRELREEKIEILLDFAKFGDDDIDLIVSNMKKHIPTITLHARYYEDKAKIHLQFYELFN